MVRFRPVTAISFITKLTLIYLVIDEKFISQHPKQPRYAWFRETAHNTKQLAQARQRSVTGSISSLPKAFPLIKSSKRVIKTIDAQVTSYKPRLKITIHKYDNYKPSTWRDTSNVLAQLYSVHVKYNEDCRLFKQKPKSYRPGL